MDRKKITMNAKFFTFKPVQQNQRLLIHNWVTQNHIKKWLHGNGLRNTLEDLDNFFECTSWGKHWIAYDNNIPFAYLLTSEHREDTITLDLFICDLNYLGKGIAVPMICGFLTNQFPNMKRILIDPEASNTRAIHVYQKVGFKITREFIANWHPVPHYQMELYMKDLLETKR